MAISCLLPVESSTSLHALNRSRRGLLTSAATTAAIDLMPATQLRVPDARHLDVNEFDRLAMPRDIDHSHRVDGLTAKRVIRGQSGAGGCGLNQIIHTFRYTGTDLSNCTGLSLEETSSIWNTDGEVGQHLRRLISPSWESVLSPGINRLVPRAESASERSKRLWHESEAIEEVRVDGFQGRGAIGWHRGGHA